MRSQAAEFKAVWSGLLLEVIRLCNPTLDIGNPAIAQGGRLTRKRHNAARMGASGADAMSVGP